MSYLSYPKMFMSLLYDIVYVIVVIVGNVRGIFKLYSGSIPPLETQRDSA